LEGVLEALICPRCGGPVSRPRSIPVVIACGFCGVALALAGAAQVHTTGEAAENIARDEHYALARVAFTQALVPLLQAGRPPYDALREAASVHLSGQADPETLARVAYALVWDFEKSTGAPALGDPMVLGRIVDAYLRVFSELRRAPQAELHLPFLTATPAGPVHFRRTVTPALFAELARRDPRAAAPKKRWWPF
jgi:hypothetical protein